MKIYTRKGDDGSTATLFGPRRSKSDARIRALGALDEVNAHLGLVLSDASLPEEIRTTLARIQKVLFEAGFELASADPSAMAGFFTAETAWLERRIDEMDAALPPLTRFILPGGGLAGARIHLARVVARRAETMLVEAVGQQSPGAQSPGQQNPTQNPSPQSPSPQSPSPQSPSPQNPSPQSPSPQSSGNEGHSQDHRALLGWFNRLSDALFMLARRANQLEGVQEVQWESETRGKSRP